MTFLDTADMYGPFTNEQLVGKAITGRRDEVQLATKFGNERNPDGSWVGLNGKPEYVRKACDASLQRLGVGHIDLYFQHRIDPTVPIEENAGAADVILSAVDLATIEAAYPPMQSWATATPTCRRSTADRLTYRSLSAGLQERGRDLYSRENETPRDASASASRA